MTNQKHHSVTLVVDRCKGCTHCLRRCPTQAIRVRDGRAHIIGDRCIDCGECIRVCPYYAKVAVTDSMDILRKFRYTIALPAPALYGQFKDVGRIEHILAALHLVGFDEVYEVARGADMITRGLDDRLARGDCKKPLISSSCPTVVRLIQLRFPELIPHIVDLKSPMEAAAREAKRAFAQARGVEEGEIGCIFITPCPAKMTAIRSPLGHDHSDVDGAVSILDIYGALKLALGKVDPENMPEVKATSYGVSWANSGGEAQAVGIDNALSVDGIDNVIHVLEEIENNKLTDLLFFEGMACPGGCVGGPLVFENSFVAKNRIRKLTKALSLERPRETIDEKEYSRMAQEIVAPLVVPELKGMHLHSDLREALRRMALIEELVERLPGLDCGSCGSPTCQTHAEDVVMGNAEEMDCLYLLKDRVRELARQLEEQSGQIPRKEETK